VKEIIIISGKGGTGKTSLVSSFAYLAENKVLCDADVDAADLHLILDPEIIERNDFFSGRTASIDQEKCVQCGLCRELCRWNAISEDFVIDPIECEGCGVCHYFCTENAVDFPLNNCGEWFISDTRFGFMVHASLGIAEENSGRLVAQVRNRAGELAARLRADRILGDGPPGTGCPVIASVSGCDLVLIVTEPTVSGVHDMERVLALAAHFGVPALVVINKADLNTEQAVRINEIAKQQNSRVIARIPFDRAVNDALMAGKTVVDYGESAAVDAIREAWAEVRSALRET